MVERLTEAQRRLLEKAGEKGVLTVYPNEDRTAFSLERRGLLASAIGCTADYFITSAGRTALEVHL